MAGGTPRHHGLGVRGGGFFWSAADPGPEICHVQAFRPHGGAVTTVVRRRAAATATTRSRTGRRLRLPQKRAHQRRNPPAVNQPGTLPWRASGHHLQLLNPLIQVDQFVRKTPQPDTDDLSPCCDHAVGTTMAGMKLKLDLHGIYNRGGDIDRALQAIINEAVTTKAALVEIIPGKGSGALKKRVLRFLEQKEIKSQYHRVEKDSNNFGRIFVHFRWK
jgi:hypothetical protein